MNAIRPNCPFENTKDCFAYIKAKGTCKALNDTNFGGRPCPFYKPKIKYDAERAAIKALYDFPEETEEEDEDEESD